MCRPGNYLRCWSLPFIVSETESSLFTSACSRLAGPQDHSCCYLPSCWRSVGTVDTCAIVFSFRCRAWDSELWSLGLHSHHFTHGVISPASFNSFKITFKRAISNEQKCILSYFKVFLMQYGCFFFYIYRHGI